MGDSLKLARHRTRDLISEHGDMLSRTQEEVLSFYENNPGSAIGHHDSEVVDKLKSGLGTQEVLDAISWLDAQGMICKTIDESHHRSPKFY